MEEPIAKPLTIRECGHDEYWLRDRIFADPSVLGLGDLQFVGREKTQSQGGRLDLLLKNPEDDSMFEVELQLGATDESHIIRTIEYWDNEKRRWPNRSHTAVLVAEEMQTQYDEKHWIDNHPGTLECAKWYKALLEKLYGEVPTKYFEDYISLAVDGFARVWLSTRKNNRAFVEVKSGEENFQEAVEHMNSDGVAFGTRKGKYLTFNVNVQQLKDNAKTHEWLASRLSPHDLKVIAKAS
jgi:hypothetical protein